MNKFIFSIKNFLLLMILFSSAPGFSQMRMTPETAANDILNNLNKKEFKKISELFDANIAAKLDDVKLGQVYASLLSKFGAFIKSEPGITTRQIDGSIIVDQLCEFQNMELICRIKFNDQNKISALQFVPPPLKENYALPEYAKPDLITETEITIPNGDYSLPGILSLPKSGSRFPVVILIHGSGPNDKDETIGPNKIFKDIALGLAAKGVAVLRYDKRTFVYGNIMMSLQDHLTIKEETTDDVKAAIKFIKTITEIDQRQIFILGHSLGGMLAPKIAAENPEVTGAILVAANARPLPDLIIDQTSYLLHQDEFTEDDKKNLQMVKRQCELAKSPGLNINTPTDSLPLHTPASYWLSLQNYDQLKVSANLDIPLLIMQGKRDYQVTTIEYDLWKQSLKEKNNVTYDLYDKLNHLMLEGEGTISAPKEYNEPHNVPDYVIENIISFVKFRK